MLLTAQVKEQRKIQHYTGGNRQYNRNKAYLSGEIRCKAIFVFGTENTCFADSVTTRFNAGLDITHIFQVSLHNILTTLRHQEGTDVVHTDIALLVRQRPTAQSLAHADFLLLGRVDNIGTGSLVVIELSQRQQAVDFGKLQLGVMLQHYQRHIVFLHALAQMLHFIRITYNLCTAWHQGINRYTGFFNTGKNAVNLLISYIHIILRTYDNFEAQSSNLTHILHRQA